MESLVKTFIYNYWPLLPCIAGAIILASVDWRIVAGVGLWMFGLLMLLMPPRIDPEALD